MISLPEFRRRVAELDGRRLKTGPRKKAFTVRLIDTGLEYTPESSGKPRRQAWRKIEQALAHYNETHSLVPGHYREITVHGSYLTAILDRLRK